MIYMVESVGFVMVDLVVVCGDLLVYFIDGCIGLFVTVDFMIILGIVGNLIEEFALLWNVTHSSAQLTLTSWLGRDSKDEELVPSVVF